MARQPRGSGVEMKELFKAAIGRFGVDAETGEPWRCKFCVFYHFCRIGRCVGFLPLDFFTEEEISLVEKAYRKIEHHERGSRSVFDKPKREEVSS